ncbi:inverse autotransporter beta domain-containing protein, partial [Enterobacter asburiae]|uniref:inverse autotransporter beta domain-containing protein n=1 Tax=Enterobacter asburiae TaxID=61645 RepID=UPI003F55E6D4
MHHRIKGNSIRRKQTLRTGLMKSVVWMNILVQVAFPMAVTVSPVIASASELRGNPFGQRTAVYTLQKGETVQSVADKFHVSLPALRKLNQLRTFAHGFDHLQAGDELDVPEPSITGKSGDDGRADGTPDATAQKVAGYASQAGGFLKNSHQGAAAASMARGMATGAAGGAIQQWLSHFGTARVQLNADEKFSLKNSQFDLLIPWYERDDMVMFSQGSLHRTDDRTQGNLGLGSRWFNDGWMVGANTFLDYDFSREHTRAGLGLEYWRDYLKLGANSYMRLSGWKDSPDVTDYQERPANGWDIRAQAWLPALPQLGGKLVFEQYYGDEVALFGKDNRQRNPHAITAGVNYTPFPLLTLGAEQRQGGSGKNDTRFDASLNFQPGVPWRQQLDPGAVGAMRSLMGSRYDLVDRNNNIVLEYRKKEVIHLHALGMVTGHPGEHKSLGVSVTSKYGLDRIDWDAGPLLAAGGLIQADSAGGFNAVLPQYHSGATGINTYIITGVAVDKKGNRSEESHTQLTVDSPQVDKAKSTFTPVSSVLAADGESKQVLTLTVKDGQQQLVDTLVQNIKIITTRGTGPVKAVRAEDVTEATVSAPVKKSTGVYEVTVTAGTRNETLTLTPEIFGETLTAAKVTISQKTPDPAHSSFGVSAGSLLAGNTPGSTLTFTAKDVHGVAIYGIADHLSFGVKTSAGVTPDAAQVTVSRVTETRTPGVYTATLTGIKADTYTVTPLYGKIALGGFSGKVTLIADRVPDVATSSLKIQSGAMTTDGMTSMSITFVAKDAYGNTITHMGSRELQFGVHVLSDAVSHTSQRGSGAERQRPGSVSSVTESQPGTYVSTLSGMKAAEYVITPVAGGTPLSSLTQRVMVGHSDAARPKWNIHVTASPTSILADGKAVSSVAVFVGDGNGEGVETNQLLPRLTNGAGLPPAEGDVTLGVLVAVPGHPGLYEATLKGTKADTYGLTYYPKSSAGISGFSGDRAKITLTATPGTISEQNSSFRATMPTIASGDTTALHFVAHDSQNKPVTDLLSRSPALEFVVKDASGNVVSQGGGNPTLTPITQTPSNSGDYSADLRGTRVGRYTIVPKVDGRELSLTATVTLKAGDVDAGESTFAFPDGVSETLESGGATKTLTFTAKDAQGNVVSGLGNRLKFVPDRKNSVKIDPISEVNGVYTASASAQALGRLVIEPEIDNKAVGALHVDVQVVPGTPVGGEGKSQFQVSVPELVADNITTATFTLTLKNTYGLLISDASTDVTVAPDNTDGVTWSGFKEDLPRHPGIYTGTLRGTRAQRVSLTPMYKGSAIKDVPAQSVTLKAGEVDASVSTFAFPDGLNETLESGGATKTLTFTAKDAQGNVISGLDKRLTFVSGDQSHVDIGMISEASGVYTASVSGKVAGTVEIVPQIDDRAVGKLHADVTVTA